ncbi:MAG TPA: GNAT family N-acetyltransferase [Solirubrobacterales bacterium]|nr:GNAT family N-acetyltransferase [Solirubrobacterales bacterium]
MGDSGQAERIEPPALHDPELIEAWRRLAELRENPFLTPEWYLAWLAAEPGEEPFLIVWRRGGEVSGVLPLVRARRAGIRVLRFAGARRGDWFTPACRPEDEAAMGSACAALLGRERSAWHLLELTRFDQDCAWPGALWEAPSGGISRARSQRLDVLPYVRFGEGGYEEYLAGRSRNFRSQLGRRRRKLEREHGLRFRQTADPARLDEDMETFFALHEERWSHRGGTSALSPGAKQAQRSFAAAALERGWLRLWVAEVDGRAGAAWYGWRIGGRYCYSLSGLSQAFEPLALGTVLLAHTIEQAAGEGASVYDLMWGDEGYKKRFETGRRQAESWALGRRGHPVALGRAGIDGLKAAGRALPEPLRKPLRGAYRAVGRR